MSNGTKIEWTDETWNVLLGCSKVSPGCDNCYAIRTAEWLHNMGQKSYQPSLTVRRGPNVADPSSSVVDWTGEVRLVEHKLEEPLRWTRPRRVFVNSMSDMFHPNVDYGDIARIFGVMASARRHTFQILTKRPKLMASIVGDVSGDQTFEQSVKWHWETRHEDQEPDVRGEWVWPLPNVWLGVSIESDRYTFRADQLRETPAAVRFISAEPLLGPLPSLDLTGIDWVIVGGESGPGARPMHPEWAREIRNLCQDGATCPDPQCHGGIDTAPTSYGEPCPECHGAEVVPVPFFFKQWGNWRPAHPGPWLREPDGWLASDGALLDHQNGSEPLTAMMRERSKSWPGHDLLDGREWKETP